MRRYYIARRERPICGLVWCVWTLREGEKRPDFRRHPNAMAGQLANVLTIIRNRMQRLEILEEDRQARRRARRGL